MRIFTREPVPLSGMESHRDLYRPTVTGRTDNLHILTTFHLGHMGQLILFFSIGKCFLEITIIACHVFHLCVCGYGPQQIGREMMKRGYMNPTAYAKANGRSKPDTRTVGDDYTWQDSTVSHMLGRMEYLGHTVNFKTYRKSYKNKKQLKNDPSEWQVFENTHEAIIDQETFDIVQRIRDGRRRLTPMGEMPLLSGMVFCADCGKKLYQVRGRNLPQKEYMVCSTYRKIKGGCSSHQIRNEVIEELLLDGIQTVTAYVRAHEEEFIKLVTKKSQAELDRSLKDGKRELEQAQSRIRKLDEIIQRLYEDNIEGKISDERFVKMSANYEEEQHTLSDRVNELKRLIDSEKESSIKVDRFLSLVRKYTDVKELTAEIIREFVEKVYVHQMERIDGNKVQRIRIIWNCIGEFTPPAITEKEKSV
jgi:site-specific DNA recombinase